MILTWLARSAAPARSEEAVEVGPGIEPPKLMSSRSTRYPASASPARGAVVLHALIDPQGHVRKTEVVSSPDKRLSKAAVAAMKARTYAPATRDGEPIDVWWTESFVFIPPEEEIATILACDPAKIEPARDTDSKDITLPELVRDAYPIVTGTIAAKGRSGHAKLQCVIDVCGRVGKCETLCTSGPEYAAAAIEAAQKRLYRPATQAGRPIAIYFTISVNFSR